MTDAAPLRSNPSRMLQQSTLRFLKQLRTHNNKAWFDANRSLYEAARADFTAFTEVLLGKLSRKDASLSHLRAKDCLFRINRDVRFSKNKAPYKTHFAAAFNAEGKKGEHPGYYLHLEPGASFAAGGFYMPESADLQKIRQEIDYEFDRWKKIIRQPAFVRQFPQGVEGTMPLVRAPKGYEETNPAITYLKMRGFIVSCPFTDAEMTDASIHRRIESGFTAMKPFIDFLRGALD